MTIRLALVAAVAVLLGGLAGCASGGDTGSASCAAVLVHDGHPYDGRGDVRRDPEVTGRDVPAVLPGCDDGGGQDPVRPDDPVRAEELADVPTATAILWHGSVYVRRGRELPAGTDRWFRAPSCRTPGTFELTGDWLGALGPKKPRFDGDLRPPYRVEMHVTSGPEDYLGATIKVRATDATDPAPGPADVKRSLWKGGEISATVRCTGDRFEAVALRAGAGR